MKNLFLFITAYIILLLAVFSVLFVSGCQENTITDPLSTNFAGTQNVKNLSTDKNLQKNNKDYQETIKFQRVLNLANSPNLYFVVTGIIKVDHRIHNPFSNPVNGAYRVTIDLSIDAEMKEMEYGVDRWTTKENQTNTVYLARGETTTLVKYYKINGRRDGMLLACEFEFTLDGVALQGMWLTFPKVHSTNCIAQ